MIPRVLDIEAVVSYPQREVNVLLLKEANAFFEDLGVVFPVIKCSNDAILQGIIYVVSP